jgi:hypothetical protein
VAADELRGTFVSPARSEERLLYQEASWRLGFDRGYSAHYLLPAVSLQEVFAFIVAPAGQYCKTKISICGLATACRPYFQLADMVTPGGCCPEHD